MREIGNSGDSIFVSQGDEEEKKKKRFMYLFIIHSTYIC